MNPVGTYNRKYRTNLSSIIAFYREQLRTFKKIGIGKKTRHGVVISDVLIDATKRRLEQLLNKKLSVKSIGDYLNDE